MRVLVLEQEALGLPDQRPDEPLRQTMVIDEANRRVMLEIHEGPPRGEADRAPGGKGPGDRRVILRMDLDPPEIYEVWDSEKSYRKTARDLNRIQEERDQVEADERRRLPLMTAAERKAFLEENFLREDGKRVVEVAKGGRKTLLGHDCEEVKVFENERQVIRAWVASDIPGSHGFFQLYRRLGAFSREVLEKVQGIAGLPLEAEITVVTAAPAYRITARTLSVKTEEVPASAFEIPPGFKEKKTEAPAVVKCPVCLKELERAEARFRYSRPEGDYFFCSKEHRKQFIDDLDRQKKPRG